MKEEQKEKQERKVDRERETEGGDRENVTENTRNVTCGFYFPLDALNILG